MEIIDYDNQLAGNPLTAEFGQFTILTGNNNAGKSTLMRYMTRSKEGAYIVSSNRTYLTGEGAQDKNYLSGRPTYLQQQRDSADDNPQKNIQVLQDLFGLKDVEKQPILDYYNKYFPGNAIEEPEDKDNSASPHLLKMNGYLITKQGSGARAILEILVKLFDSSISLLCIDEPELALKPTLQKQLFKAIRDKSADKQIIIATHSHHFLDHETVSNNYICFRDDANKINLSRISSALEFRNVIFELLGNDLKDLGLPNKILIVEGITDVKYISKMMQLLGKDNYSLFDAGSDSKIKTAAEGISAYLKYIDDLAPVYKDRIRILSDVQDSDRRVREWRILLDDPTDTNHKVKVLPKNGIEYYYPEALMRAIFDTTDDLDTIVSSYIRARPNGYNGVELSKNELADQVLERLTIDSLDANEVKLFIGSLNE